MASAFSRCSFAETNSPREIRVVPRAKFAGQKHLRGLHLFGAGKKLVGEFQSVAQFQASTNVLPIVHEVNGRRELGSWICAHNSRALAYRGSNSAADQPFAGKTSA